MYIYLSLSLYIYMYIISTICTILGISMDQELQKCFHKKFSKSVYSKTLQNTVQCLTNLTPEVPFATWLGPHEKHTKMQTLHTDTMHTKHLHFKKHVRAILIVNDVRTVPIKLG